MIDYQAPMLDQVDYSEIEDDVGFSLIDLEHGTLENCCDFLDGLKSILMEKQMMQVPELLVAHLCAYLGAMITLHTVHHAEKLESPIIDLIIHQAHAAYELFNQYPLNSTIKSQEQKNKNLERLRKNSPGSIVVQTIRLGRVMSDILNELRDNRQDHFKGKDLPKQSSLFCPVEILIKLMLVVGGELDGLSDNYVLNQMAIQMGWLIGYFSHLDHKSPDKTEYFSYGLPVLKLHREQVYKLMHAYAEEVHAQEEIDRHGSKESPETKELLSEIHRLIETTHGQRLPAINDFQKQTAITQAGIEKMLVELLNEHFEPKIILMSLFYFWFTLEAPMCGADIETIDNSDVFSHMTQLIALVRKTALSLPTPELTPEIKALNEKMQALKKHLPSPERLDQVPQEKVVQHTAHVNQAVHTLTCDYIKQNIHIEAITNVLFGQWLRLSVFFGVSENEWQKMDYYLPEILETVREYLKTNAELM